ncbi:MAG: hypothetical protein J2P37_35990, partial [Ktedonobacteraceae bacterium]|nr:hypothetical protein [Ktedonobacteraceae bacterium]
PSVFLMMLVGLAPSLLSGCHAAIVALDVAGGSPLSECPPDLRGQIRLSASAVAIKPSGAPVPSTQHRWAVRRLLISASPPARTPPQRVVRSVLTVILVGGIFAGQASTASAADASST